MLTLCHSIPRFGAPGMVAGQHTRDRVLAESQLPLDQAVTVVTASYVVNRILRSVLIRVSLIQTSIREYSYV